MRSRGLGAAELRQTDSYTEGQEQPRTEARGAQEELAYSHIPPPTLCYSGS